jgi:hypothetical protein
MYETDFERLLMSQSSHLYPEFHLVKFNFLVSSEYGSGRPDLALIDKSYRSWWVVEVELGSHNLRSHVEEQVAIFSCGSYGREAARYLQDRCPFLDGNSLGDLMQGAPPRVLVIVNQPRPDWSPTLSRWDALLAVVELFRDNNNNVILRVNGEHPRRNDKFLTTCRIDPLLRKSLVIDAPAALGVPSGGKVELWMHGGVTEWRRIDASGTSWLMPIKRCPLGSSSGTFRIFRTDDNRLVLAPDRPSRRSRS